MKPLTEESYKNADSMMDKGRMCKIYTAFLEHPHVTKTEIEYMNAFIKNNS